MIKQKIRGAVLGSILLAVLLIGIAGILAYTATDAMVSAQSWVRRTDRTMLTLARLESALSEAQLAARNYVRSGDSTDLRQFERLSVRMEQHFSALYAEADSPRLRTELDSLRATVSSVLLSHTRLLRPQPTPAAAQAELSNLLRHNDVYLERVARQVNRLVQLHEAQTARHVGYLSTVVAQSRWLVVGIGILSLVMGASGYLFTRGRFRRESALAVERQRLNEQLQSANAEMEATNEELLSSNEEIIATNEQLSETVAQLEEAQQQLQEYAERELRRSQDMFELVVNHLPHPLVVYGADMRIQLANTAATQVAADTTPELLNRLPSEVSNPEHLQQYLPSLLEAFQLGRRTTAHLHLNGGEQVYEIQFTPLVESGTTTRVIAAAYELTERLRHEAELRQEKESYRLLAENFPNGAINILTDDLRLEFIEGRELREVAIDPRAAVGAYFPDFFAPEEQEVVVAGCRRAFGGERTHWQAGYHGRIYHFVGVPMPTRADGQRRILVVSQNDTERLQAEQQLQASLAEKEILLAEIHHRVKNNLAIVSGLLQMQASTVDNNSIQRVLRDSQNRVHSMALIHEKLYRSESLAQINFCEYAEELIATIQAGFEVPGQQVGIHLDCEEMWMDIDTAVPCGLILNELITNAFNHAFVDRTEGRLSLLLHRDADEYRMTVMDDGAGARLDDLRTDVTTRPSKQHPSLGLKLVHGLAGQLHGRVLLRDNQPGLRVDVCFPVPELRIPLYPKPAVPIQ